MKERGHGAGDLCYRRACLDNEMCTVQMEGTPVFVLGEVQLAGPSSLSDLTLKRRRGSDFRASRSSIRIDRRFGARSHDRPSPARWEP